MTSLSRNRKFVLVYPNDYYLPPRSEGRIKSYDSCNDIRAWSLHESERSDHLFDLIKIDNDPCLGLIPKHILADILAGLKKDTTVQQDDGITFTAPLQYDKPIIGDSQENERELKRIIAEKDGKIASLQRQIKEVKDKCDAEMKKLKESFEGENLGTSATADCDQTIKSLKEQILKLQEEAMRTKEEKAKPQGFGDSEALLKEKDAKIEELERKIKEITNERDRLLEQNADLSNDIDGLNVHLESLSNLTMELNAFADKALLKSGDGKKYLKLLQETLKTALDLDVANAKTAAGELKKKRKELEEQIKAQLDEALEMYIKALEDIQEKQMEIDRLKQELKKLKQENNELVKKYEDAQYNQQFAKEDPEKNQIEKQQEIDKLSKQLKEMKMKNEELAKKCEDTQNSVQTDKEDLEKMKIQKDKQAEVDKLSKELNEMKMKYEQLARKCGDTQEGHIQDKNEELRETTKQKHFPEKPISSSIDTTSRNQNICQMKECHARCSQVGTQRRNCQPIICCEGRRMCISSDYDICDSLCAFCSELNSPLPVCKPSPQPCENEAPRKKTVLDVYHEVPREDKTSGFRKDQIPKTNRIIHDNWDISLPPRSDHKVKKHQPIDLEVQLQDYSLMVQIKK